MTDWLQRHDAVRWSPDGSEIFFNHHTRGSDYSDVNARPFIPTGNTIYAVAADGSYLREVTRIPRDEDLGRSSTTYFDVSPDGTSLVYSTCEDGSFDLVRVTVDGSQATTLTDSWRFESLPTWSPDGSRIAFLAEWGSVHGSRDVVLRTMTPDGTVDRDREAISGPPSSAVFAAPKWSPDGKRLAFVTYVDESHSYNGWSSKGYELRTVAADGSVSKRLTETVSGPTWSPDGTRIAFAKPDGNGLALFTMAADGSDFRRVASINDWFDGERLSSRAVRQHPVRGWVPAVAWSPTGEHILFVDGRLLKVVTPDGISVGTAPIYFNGGPIPAWSPDGSRIAIAAPVDADYTEFDNTFFRFDVVATMAPDGTDVVPLVWASLTNELVAEQSARYRADSVAEACSAGLVVKDPAANPGLVRDCQTLADLRDALIGRLLVNWTADTPIREWAGVIVDGTPPRVTGLKTTIIHEDYARVSPYYSPLGIVPPALAALTALKTLDLAATGPWGTIPPELGRLRKLEYLDLSDSGRRGLWGELPTELGNLTELQVLNLAGNQFEGPIPPELGRLVNLKTLYLSGNSFRGCIPPELHGTANNDLADLGLADCEPG